MAKTVGNEEERERRIKLVGMYYLENDDASMRDVAKYFSKNEFSISAKTVKQYIDEYKRRTIYTNEIEEINKKIERNTPDDISIVEIRERVFKAARLALEGYSQREISEILGVTQKVIERDLSRRLGKICDLDEDLKIYNLAVANAMHSTKINTIYKNRKVK